MTDHVTKAASPRSLTAEELQLVAGGWAQQSDGIWPDLYVFEDVYITGHYVYDTDSSWFTPAEYYEEGSGTPTAAETPLETPCVEAWPAGIDPTAMNSAALAASNAIAALDDEHLEYSSIVWALDGVVGWTIPYTDGKTNEVNWVGGLSQVPDGAKIIGIVHNHPDGIMTDTYPSGAGNEPGEDWGAYETIVDYNGWPRGISVDQNMLLWIYSDEDHKTHVYDKTDKNQTSPSCSLN